MVLTSTLSIGISSISTFADIRFVVGSGRIHATSIMFPRLHVSGVDLRDVAKEVIDAIHKTHSPDYIAWVEPNFLPLGQYKPDSEAEVVYRVIAKGADA